MATAIEALPRPPLEAGCGAEDGELAQTKGPQEAAVSHLPFSHEPFLRAMTHSHTNHSPHVIAYSLTAGVGLDRAPGAHVLHVRHECLHGVPGAGRGGETGEQRERRFAVAKGRGEGDDTLDVSRSTPADGGGGGQR
jgi:hypothetical protein